MLVVIIYGGLCRSSVAVSRVFQVVSVPVVRKFISPHTMFVMMS